MKTLYFLRLSLKSALLLAAPVILFQSETSAQYPRKVLIENFDAFFTMSQAQVVGWLDSCSEKYSGQVIPLRYQVTDCLAGCDPEDELSLNKTTSIDNRSYYYPYHTTGEDIYFDGIFSLMPWQLSGGTDSVFMAQRLAVPSPLNIAVQHTFNAAHDSIHIHVEITSAINFMGGTTSFLRIVPFEETIEFEEAPGTYNYSVTSVPRVARDLVPDQTGVYVGSINAGATASYDFDWALYRVYDMANLRVAAFVQDDVTHEVIQAAQSLPQAVPLADCSVRLTKKHYCFQNNAFVYPEIEIGNAGAFTIHHLSIDFGINGQALQNMVWTGTLLPQTSVSVPLAIPAPAPGSYIIEVNVQSDLPYDTKPFNNILHYEPLANANNDQHLTFYVIPPTGYPLYEGFESGIFPPAGWILETTGCIKHWDESPPGGFMSSPTSMLATLGVMFKYHVHNERTVLTTPSIDFTNANSPVLTFDRAYRCKDYGGNFVPAYDTLNIWASTDCGTSWQLVYQKDAAALTTYSWCSMTNYWTPSAAGDWTSDSIPLGIFDGLSSVILRFEAVSGLGQSLYLDNINIDYGIIATAVPGNLDKDFSTYPDPASSFFTVRLNGKYDLKNTVFNLRDLAGRVAYSCGFSDKGSVQVDCRNFSPGVYFGETTDAGRRIVKKIIIQE